jgi:hypothetical protein
MVTILAKEGFATKVILALAIDISAIIPIKCDNNQNEIFYLLN